MTLMRYGSLTLTCTRRATNQLYSTFLPRNTANSPRITRIGASWTRYWSSSTAFPYTTRMLRTTKHRLTKGGFYHISRRTPRKTYCLSKPLALACSSASLLRLPPAPSDCVGSVGSSKKCKKKSVLLRSTFCKANVRRPLGASIPSSLPLCYFEDRSRLLFSEAIRVETVCDDTTC